MVLARLDGGAWIECVDGLVDGGWMAGFLMGLGHDRRHSLCLECGLVAVAISRMVFDTSCTFHSYSVWCWWRMLISVEIQFWRLLSQASLCFWESSTQGCIVMASPGVVCLAMCFARMVSCRLCCDLR